MPKQALQPGRFLAEPRSALLLQEHICDVYLALMLSLFLLFFYPDVGYKNISGAKRDCLYVLTLTYVVTLLVSVIVTLLLPSRGTQAAQELKQRLRSLGVAFWAMLAYLLFTLISALLSSHPDDVWFGASRNEGFLTQLLYVLIFSTLLLFGKPKTWHLYVVSASLLLMIVIVVQQVLGGNPLGLYPRGKSYANSTGHFLGTIGNADFIGSFLCILIPLLLTALIRGKGLLRLVLLLPIAAALYFVLQIDVLACYVGLSAGLVLSLPIIFRFPGKATLRYYIVLLALGLLGCAALYVLDINSGMFHEMHEILHGHIDDFFGSSRIYIWRQVLARIWQKPWFGYGPDTMRTEHLQPFMRFDPDRKDWVIATINTAHNEYLNIWFHQGIFALLAYLTGVGTVLAHFFRYGKKNPFVAGLGAAALCHLLQAFFGIGQPFTSPFVWITLGLSEAAILRDRCGPLPARPVFEEPEPSLPDS